jgi:hypothetical protein
MLAGRILLFFNSIKESGISVFNFWTNEKLTLNFGYLRRCLPEDSVGEFHRMIIKMPEMKNGVRQGLERMHKHSSQGNELCGMGVG